jgi:hypothetical protein
MEVIMKIWYLLLVGLSLIVACGNQPPPSIVTLIASELNPVFGSSVTFTATAAPAGNIVKLELLEGEIVLKTVVDTATLEQSELMGVVSKRSFTARVTDTAGVIANSAVVEVVTKSEPVVTLSATPNPNVVGGSSTLRATVVGPVGIKEVSFFESGTLLGTDTNAPFTFVINDFSVEGFREFKAVATDNAGFKGERLIKIEVISGGQATFQIETDLNFCVFFIECNLLSPDDLIIDAVYDFPLPVSQRTKWSILQKNGDLAPTDGSFGTIVAIPGQVDGLFAPKVQYIPPQISSLDESLSIRIQGISEQDPTFKTDQPLAVRKKGTLTGISVAASVTVKAGASQILIVDYLGVVGTIDTSVSIDFDSLGVSAKLECESGSSCLVATNAPILKTQRRFILTGLRFISGQSPITLRVVSNHDETIFGAIKVTVTP